MPSQTFTTTDVYQYLSCPRTKRVTLQISNASVLIGFGTGHGPQGSASYYDGDETFLPITGGVARVCDEIRVKSAVLATPAVAILKTA